MTTLSIIAATFLVILAVVAISCVVDWCAESLLDRHHPLRRHMRLPFLVLFWALVVSAIVGSSYHYRDGIADALDALVLIWRIA